MAARRPFWKWHRWKSIGFCLWPPSTRIWNLKLKFQSKLDLCSGNHVVYRQTDGQTDKVNPVYPPPTSLGGDIMSCIDSNKGQLARGALQQDIRPKLILNSNPVESRLPMTYFSILQSFWNFTQSAAVILPCSVQNFTNDWIKETDVMGKRDFMRWLSEGNHILHSPPARG